MLLVCYLIDTYREYVENYLFFIGFLGEITSMHFFVTSNEYVINTDYNEFIFEILDRCNECKGNSSSIHLSNYLPSYEIQDEKYHPKVYQILN